MQQTNPSTKKFAGVGAANGGSPPAPHRPHRMAYNKQQENEKKKRFFILLFSVLLLLVSAGLIWYFIFGPGSVPLIDRPVNLDHMVVGGDVRDGLFTKGMTAEEIEAAMQAQADRDNFELQIGTEMHFADGGSMGNIEIVNPKTNVYPMSVVIHLTRDNSIVYESGVIKPQQYISEGKLLQNLPAGRYTAIARVSIYNEEGTKVEGKTSAEVEIIVGS